MECYLTFGPHLRIEIVTLLRWFTAWKSWNDGKRDEWFDERGRDGWIYGATYESVGGLTNRRINGRMNIEQGKQTPWTSKVKTSKVPLKVPWLMTQSRYNTTLFVRRALKFILRPWEGANDRLRKRTNTTKRKYRHMTHDMEQPTEHTKYKWQVRQFNKTYEDIRRLIPMES